MRRRVEFALQVLMVVFIVAETGPQAARLGDMVPNVHPQGMTGVRRMGVVMLNVDGHPGLYPVDHVRQVFFGDENSLADYYHEVSRGSLTVIGDVLGPFPYDSSQDVPQRSAELALEQLPGVSLRDYDMIVWVFSGADWLTAASPSGRYARIVVGDDARTAIHEVGHLFGLGHADLWPWGGGYGDVTDDMGSGHLTGFNAPNRYALGWLENVETVSTGGLFRIGALELTRSDHPQALRFYNPDVGNYVTLSFRTPRGYSSNLGPDYLDRLHVHIGDDLVGAFGDGEIYSDPANELSVEVLEHDTESVTVEIRMDCVRQTPEISVEPSLVSLRQHAGEFATVNIRNRDTIGCGSTSTLALSVDAPTGFETELSRSSFILPSGASARSTLWVRSSSAGYGSLHVAVTTTSDQATAMVGALVEAQQVEGIPPLVLDGTLDGKGELLLVATPSDAWNSVTYWVNGEQILPYQSGESVCPGSGAPCRWTVPDRPGEAFLIVAKAEHTSGVRVASNTLYIALQGNGDIDRIPPVVRLSSPQHWGTRTPGTSITAQAYIHDASAIRSVTFRRFPMEVHEEVYCLLEVPPYTCSIALPQGEPSLQFGVVAIDEYGNEGIDKKTLFLAARTGCPPLQEGNAPTLALVDPTKGSAVTTGAHTIGATATDDVGVASITYELDGQYLAGLYGGDPSVRWWTRRVPNGPHTLAARACDVNGNVAAQQVDFIVDNAPTDTLPPEVVLRVVEVSRRHVQAVQNQVVSGDLLLDVNAQDDAGMQSVKLYYEGRRLATGTDQARVIVSSTALPDGLHAISARATDLSGNSSEAEIRLRVRNQVQGDFLLPSIALTEPAPDTIAAGTISLAASATDNTDIREVRFLIDGSLLGSAFVAPFTWEWDSSAVADGSHQLTAEAIDAAGNVTVSSSVPIETHNVFDGTCDQVCGDGIRQGDEACDGLDLGLAACDQLGFDGGELACRPDCRLDTSGCTFDPICGNGVIEEGEDCEGGDLASVSCPTLGYDLGRLSCAADCRFDTSSCVQVTLVTPSRGDVLTGPTTIQVSTTDDTLIRAVHFMLEPYVIGLRRKPPFERTFDPSLFPEGEYIVRARVHDLDGRFVLKRARVTVVHGE